MFVVLGASGNTGKVVAETLLSQKRNVRVVVRDAAKGQAWKEAGADVSIADVEDGAALKRAFSGAEGAYVLLPPNFSSTQVRVDNNRRASTIAAAIEAAGVPHVVMLSSIGAQQPHGTGPVLGLRDAEATFTRGRAAATFVRAAYLMENWGGALFAVAQGVLPTFLLADKAIPLVATRDVGTAAARLLAEGGSGKRVIELAGPREYSPRLFGKVTIRSGVGRLTSKRSSRHSSGNDVASRRRDPPMKPRHAAFAALDPFFELVQRGLSGLVDGDHYFDTIAENAIFEFRYDFPGWPQRIEGRDALMALYLGYGDNIVLHRAESLVVHRCDDGRVVVLEYDVHGRVVASGAAYDNRFVSILTVENRKIVRWRDYMDSLSAMRALSTKL